MNRPQLLEHLLLRLESGLPDAEILAPEEIRGWPARAFDCLKAQGIILPDAHARSVTCDECAEDHVEEVEPAEYPTVPHLRYFIPCPICGRVEVPVERLRRWRIDLAGLAMATSRLLGAHGESKELRPQRVWDLGWAEIKGVVRDLILVRGLGWPDKIDLEPHLTARNSPIALTLGESHRVQPRDTPTAPLFRVLSLSDSGLAVDTRYFATLPVPAHRVIPLASEQAQYAFKKLGDYWVVVFEGTQSIVRQSRGLEYVAYLLGNPGKDVSALDLGMLGKTRPWDEAAAEFRTMGEERLAQQGLHISGLGTAGPKLDRGSKSTYKQTLKELTEEIEEAEESGDTDRMQELEQQKAWLVKELAGAVGLGGRNREAADIPDKARAAVSQAIARAIGHINASDPKCGQFLSNSIKKGDNCGYFPDREIKWMLS